MKPLKIAIVGAGRLGRFHAQKAAASDDVELVAVVDPDPQARNRVAAECNTESRADYFSLFGRIDAAVIAAPTKLHHRLSLELLRRKIHLLVEKPICATRAEADELVDAARDSNVVLQVGHVERFNPAFSAAATHVVRPKYIETVRSSPFPFRSTDVGVVLDVMIHDLDLILSMVRSPVRKVEALGLSVLGGHEDMANARLTFDCGCVANLSASRVSCETVRRMHVWSLRGFAAVDFVGRTATTVNPSKTLLRREFDVDALSPEEVEHYKEHLDAEHLPRRTQQFETVDALAAELQDFVGAVRTPRVPRVSGAAGRDALAVAEKVLARIHAHSWDNTTEGLTGPLVVPGRGIIPAPHFKLKPVPSSLPRKEAG